MDAPNAAALIARCRRDPAYFAETILGISPWSRQVQILEACRSNRRVAVRACRGVGKTYIAAVIVLWFLFVHGPGTKVITTAPTQHQVDNMLWSDIRALYQRAEERGFELGGRLTKNRLEVDADWYAVGLSSNEPDRYLGFHAPAILFLADEASGVPQAILDAAKGYGTGAVSLTLYIGNGTQTSGGLYEAFTTDAELWARIGVSMFDSPNMTAERCAPYPRVVEYMARKGLPYSTEDVSDGVRAALPGPQVVEEALIEWGEDSPLFAMFVLGEFPAQGATTVIGIRDVEAAQARYHVWEPTEGVTTCDLVCDVARFGDDETAISVREHGDIDRLTVVEAYVGQDTMRTAGALVQHVRSLDGDGLTVRRIVVDDAGVGGGVVDRLRELKREGVLPAHVAIVGFNGGAKPKTKADYPNARSEAWFHFADELERIALDPDAKLLADLVAPTYVVDSKGRRVVEMKKDTKKRLKRSPDRGDGALMAFAPAGFVAEGKRSKGKVYS